MVQLFGCWFSAGISDSKINCLICGGIARFRFPTVLGYFIFLFFLALPDAIYVGHFSISTLLGGVPSDLQFYLHSL